VLYLRDEHDHSVWSATPSPASCGGSYVVRHGQGYSVFERPGRVFASELRVFLDPDSRAKIYHLKVTNLSAAARTLSAFAFVDFALGASRHQAQHTVATGFVPAAHALLAENPFSSSPERCAFLVSSRDVLSYTGDRDDFLGVDGSRKHPQGLARARLSGDVGRGLSPCGALHVQAELASGATETFVFVLGDASDRNEALAAATRHAQRNDWDALFERAQAAWNERACWSECGSYTAWAMAECLKRDARGVCLDRADHADRACLRSCRISGGPYLPDIFDF
jgi:cellobiose phosphorylase